LLQPHIYYVTHFLCTYDSVWASYTVDATVNWIVIRSSLGLSQLCFENHLLYVLLSSAQRFSLLCSKLSSQNQDYAQDQTVLLEFPNCWMRASDCSIRVSRSYFHEVWKLSTKNNYSSKCFDVEGSNNVHCVHFTAVFWRTHCTFNYYSRKSSYYAGIMLNAFANLLCSKLCRHNWCKRNHHLHKVCIWLLK